MAASLATMLPVILVFFAAQRLFIKGIPLLYRGQQCPSGCILSLRATRNAGLPLLADHASHRSRPLRAARLAVQR
jgi:hypothetical protein